MAFALRLFALLALALLAGCVSEPPRRPLQPVLAPGQAQRDTEHLAAFKAVLLGNQLSPAVSGAGSGELVAVFDRDTGLLRWKVSFSGLSGPVSRAMFHRGKHGAEVLPVGSDVTSHYEGRATLSPAQQDDLLAGRWHVRISTARNPQGEIGGRLIEQH